MPFGIFVCTACSGVHMQVGQRVKSVTLADFSATELEAMAAGGNEVRVCCVLVVVVMVFGWLS